MKQPFEFPNTPVSRDKITELLEKETVKLDLDIKPHSLLPAKSYIERMPHAALHWLNETSPQKAYYRKDFDFDAQHFLNDLGIDTRNGTIDVAAVRRCVYNTEELQRLQSDEMARNFIAVRDPSTFRLTYGKRVEAVNKLTKNKTVFNETIKKVIDSAFADAFKERIETIKSACTMAHSIQMKEFFKEFKEFLHHERFYVCVDTASEIYQQAALNHLSMPFRIGGVNDNLQGLVEPLAPTDLKRYKLTDFLHYSELKDYYRGKLPRLLTPELMVDLKERLNTATQLLNGLTSSSELEKRLKALEETRCFGADSTDTSDTAVSATAPNKPQRRVAVESSYKNSSEETSSAEETDLELIDRLDNEEEMEHDEVRRAGVDNDDSEDHEDHEDNEDHEQVDLLNSEANKLAEKLNQELYVKTGYSDRNQALKAMASPSFKLDLQAMKRRRAEVIKSVYGGSDKIDTPLKHRKILVHYFGELMARPQMDEVDESIYAALEIESFNELQDLITRTRLNFDRLELDYDDFDYDFEIEQLEELKLNLAELDPARKENDRILVDFADRVKLDEIYLKAVYGDRAYLELNYAELDDAAFMKSYEDSKLCDLNTPADVWLEQALFTYIKSVFSERKTLEQHLDRASLLAYDKGLQAHFTPAAVRRGLLLSLNNNIGVIRMNDRADSLAKIAEDEEEVQLEKPNISEAHLKNLEFHRFIEADQMQVDRNIETQGKQKPKKSYLDEMELMNYTDFLFRTANPDKLLKEQEYMDKWSGDYHISKTDLAKQYKAQSEYLIGQQHKFKDKARLVDAVETMLKSQAARDKMPNAKVAESFVENFDKEVKQALQFI